MSKIVLAGIVKDSITDGPGIRVTLFCQGCPHRCDGCHNPQTHPFEGGKEYTINQLLKIINESPLTSGVTFSGGEPICQAAVLLPLAKEIAKTRKELAIYSGYTFEEIVVLNKDALELLKTADILVDGKYIKEQRSLNIKFRGSKNQRVIDLKKTFETDTIILENSKRWN